MDSNLLYLAIQSAVQNVSRDFQASGNILRSDRAAKRNVIKNMR